MVVYDDTESSEKVKLYDKGITVKNGPDPYINCLSGYRTGDMYCPQLDVTEALRVEAQHFADCIENGKTPLTDGYAGLRVVTVLEAATESYEEPRAVRTWPQLLCVARCVHRASLERTMSVPFLDLKTQYLAIKDEVLSAVSRVFDSTQYVLGSEVAAFEEEFAALLRYPLWSSCEHGNECTASRSVGRRRWERRRSYHGSVHFRCDRRRDCVRRGDTGLCGRRSCDIYDGSRADRSGDHLKDTGDSARPSLWAAADMNAIREIADRHGLLVIEDACQAHGAEYRGRRAGSMGALGCFSFYPGKNLGVWRRGHGHNRQPEFARTVRMLRDWGAEKKYHHTLKGFNYRMEGIQGAILRIKLRYLEAWTEARRANASHIWTALKTAA